jgi:hypothetical protein
VAFEMLDRLACHSHIWETYYSTAAKKLLPFGPPYSTPFTLFPVVSAWPVTTSDPSLDTLYDAMVP